MSNNRMFIPRRMHRSPAFRELTTSSTLILFEFLYRRQMIPIRENWIIKNNGEIILTYAEIRKRFGIARSTIRSSIDQLVKLGFIDIAHHGGGMMKDCSKYGISERWKDYGKDVFIEKSRKKDSRKLGFTKDNWEKQTGRKRKNKSKISITDNTSSGIAGNTYKYKKPKKPITSGINHATHKKNPNYYIEKGLEVLEAMNSTQYH
tara:strand:- start:308 stop:922 length:615 start_codon:yes stop_codon:yes gene_type:complete